MVGKEFPGKWAFKFVSSCFKFVVEVIFIFWRKIDFRRGCTHGAPIYVGSSERRISRLAARFFGKTEILKN
jgi:hypothetical protein